MSLSQKLPLDEWILLYRLRRAAEWMLRAVPVGAALALGTSLPLMLSAALLRREFVLLAGGLILGCTFAGGGLGFLWPVTPLQVARHVERTFGLKERLSTALEWQAHPENPLFEYLQADALRAAQRVTTSELLAFHLPRWQLWLTLALLIATIVTGSLRVPFERAAVHRQEQQAIQREIQAVEALRQEIAAREDLTAEEKAQLDEILAQAAQSLAQAKHPDEASAALEEARQRLKALSPEQAQAMAEALQNAGQQLSASNTPLQGVGQALAQNNLLQAAQELSTLDLSNLDASQREALAGQLNALAQSLAATNPDLAAQLQQAAQDLQNGDTTAAQQALTQAGQSLSTAARRLQQAAAAQQLATQLGQGQQRLLATGQDAQGNGSGQSGNSSGQQNGQGSGQSNNGSGLWNGQGGNGSGSGGGNSQPGGEAGSQPIQPNTQRGHNEDAPYEPLSASGPRLGGGQGTVTLPGSDAQGTLLGKGGVTPSEDGTLEVPYQDVLPQYLDAYRQAIDDESIPPQLREVIREYFGALEP